MFIYLANKINYGSISIYGNHWPDFRAKFPNLHVGGALYFFPRGRRRIRPHPPKKNRRSWIRTFFLYEKISLASLD
jgi:hypothetical protein